MEFPVYMESQQGTSDKFYSIEVNGTIVSMRHGRNGTTGVLQEKDFPTPEAALEFATKQGWSKLRGNKGYRRLQPPAEFWDGKKGGKMAAAKAAKGAAASASSKSAAKPRGGSKPRGGAKAASPEDPELAPLVDELRPDTPEDAMVVFLRKNNAYWSALLPAGNSSVVEFAGGVSDEFRAPSSMRQGFLTREQAVEDIAVRALKHLKLGFRSSPAPSGYWSGAPIWPAGQVSLRLDDLAGLMSDSYDSDYYSDDWEERGVAPHQMVAYEGMDVDDDDDEDDDDDDDEEEEEGDYRRRGKRGRGWNDVPRAKAARRR
jgi:predicted DNA-binding WGR domain protein